tara:strand:- start:446 stop:727 length:282 start_codon:yes stop_codon:yes gene_type:complete
MIRKLTGYFFVFSANRLINGKVIYFSQKKGWSEDFNLATKIKKSEIRDVEEIIHNDSHYSEIVNPYLIEIDEYGKILRLREKIRFSGFKLEGY